MIATRSIFLSLVFLSSSLMAVSVSADTGDDLFGSLLPRTIDEDEYNDLKSNGKTLKKTSEEEVIEFTPIFSFLRSEPQDRHLVESCETGDHGDRCAAALTSGFFGLDLDASIYTGCGAMLDEKDGGFCVDEETGTKLCCGSSGDCCTWNVGALVGIALANIFIFAVCVFGCCFCCKCCCMYDKLHGNNTGNSSEVVVTKPPEAAPVNTKTNPNEAHVEA